METGEYQIGTDPKRDKTGKGTAVRIIKVKSIIPGDEAEAREDEEINLFYALGKNLHVYNVEEKNFEKPGFKDERVEAFKEKTEGKGKYKSYLGYEFGEVIPNTIIGYKTLIEEMIGEITDENMEKGFLVFLGTEPDTDDPETEDLVRLCWLKKENDDKAQEMDEGLVEKIVFVKNIQMPMEAPKRMTVHYINNDGEKSKMAVNSENEVTDMKEFLYKFDN